MDPLSEVQKALFLPLFQKRMEQYATLSPQLQAKGMELYLKSQTDPAYKAQVQAQTLETFKAADTDGNGVLNKATFHDFMEKIQANSHAKIGGDNPLKSDPETVDKWYEAVNTLNPEVDGITMDDYHMMMEIGKGMMPLLKSNK